MSYTGDALPRVKSVADPLQWESNRCTFTCLIEGTTFCHVFYYHSLKFALAVLLVKQVGHPGSFCCVSACAPHQVAGLDELVGNMASNETIGTCDEDSGSRRDGWRLSVEVGRHDGRAIKGDECYARPEQYWKASDSRVCVRRDSLLRIRLDPATSGALWESRRLRRLSLD